MAETTCGTINPGQPLLHRQPLSINALLSPLRLQHLSPFKSPQSPDSAELMLRSDGSSEAVTVIFFSPNVGHISDASKKQMISRSVEQDFTALPAAALPSSPTAQTQPK